ncbi:MAG TPA: hypothetical protein PLZ86_03955 [bacterium]|nr:hypothetical protein [bacterium]
MSTFEFVMLLCFGVSWPFSIAKSLSTGRVDGKSPVFMSLVILGYACGFIHKWLYMWDWVAWLYAANLLMVASDLALYFRLRERPAAQGI